LASKIILRKYEIDVDGANQSCRMRHLVKANDFNLGWRAKGKVSHKGLKSVEKV